MAIQEARVRDLALQELEMRTAGGTRLFFSLRFPATDTAEVMQTLLRSTSSREIDYIDFRVERRAYYQ